VEIGLGIKAGLSEWINLHKHFKPIIIINFLLVGMAILILFEYINC
jgi:hypothetical protein